MILYIIFWFIFTFSLPYYLLGPAMGPPFAVPIDSKKSSVDSKNKKEQGQQQQEQEDNSSIETRSNVSNIIINSEGLKESKVYRRVGFENELTSTPPNVSTLHDILEHALKNYGDKDGLGYRDIVDTIIEEKEISKIVDGETKKETKKWTFYELSPYKWYSYKQVYEMAKFYGSGLIKLGLSPKDVIMIYGKTSVNWMLTAHAAFFHNISISTAYDNLGLDGLTYSVNETECKAIFVDNNLISSIKTILPDISKVNVIITNGEVDEIIKNELKNSYPNLKISTVDETIKLGQENLVDSNLPKSDDIACIMYTSGSTGQPKGVVLTHSNVLGGAAGAYTIIKPIINHTDRYLAYLPLAHVLEFVVEFIAQYCGLALGYGSVRTLTDLSVRNCKGDIRELAPSVMTGVPAVWETIRKGVVNKVNQVSPLKRAIFKGALSLKWNLMRLGYKGEFLDKIAFKNIKDMTGGKLRFALSGGAPIAPETQQFMSTCLCPILQGYGLTETVGMGCIQLPTLSAMTGIIGPPTSAVELKLVQVKDSSYSPDNKPNPQGELWIKGPPVLKEYFKQKELTNESITEDRWFKTGDVAEVNSEGIFSIIDRKKNIVKLSNGEYIALEKLEARYKASNVINQILVYADPKETYIVALINPLEKSLPELAKIAGLSENEHPDVICENKKVVKYILEDLKKINLQNNLTSVEMISNIRVLSELWTPENNYLTAAQKLRRNYIIEQEKQHLNEMYQEGKII